VKADDVPDRLETCDMYHQAYLLQSTYTQEEVQYSTLPSEKHMYDVVNDILLPQWRAEGVPAVEEVNRIEERMAEDGYKLLYSLAHYEIGNLAPLPAFNVAVDDLTVQFSTGATDPDGSIAAHSWVFGDLTGTSTEASPSYTYDDPGTYLVSYTVEDNDIVTSTAWRYIDVGMYKLHLGIDPETGEDIFPRETAEYDYFTAAAGSLMNLVFLDPEYAQDQQYLYSTYHQGPAGEEMAPAELATALSAEAGSPYHFSPYGDTDQDLAIRRFIHWMDYQVPGVAEPNVPAMVPVESTSPSDANWVVVRGFASDIDPCDQGDIWFIPDVELFGVWLNDPRDQGLGYNYYQEAADFMTAFTAVEGEYLSIVEPPEGADGKRLDQLDKQLASGIRYRMSKPNPRLSRPTLDVQDDIDWSAVLPSVLQADEAFMAMLEAAVEKRDFLVEGVDFETLYRLILLGPEDDALSTLPRGRITVGVDLGGRDGEFRKASWTGPGQAYVPMGDKKAVEIAMGYIKDKQAKVERLSRVWDASFDTSPFQPSHRVKFTTGETVIVHPDGTVLLP
jgi:PKD repeat protein